MIATSAPAILEATIDVTYFKATRPNGTDFRTGTVDYAAALESGEPLTIPEAKRTTTLCSSGILYAADIPVMTMYGGRWPCRLFRVEGKPVASDGHKHGFYSLTVIEALPAHQVFGPNGEAVAALIERAGVLTAAEFKRLRADRDAVEAVVRDASWADAWTATGEGAARYFAWSAAGDAASKALAAARYFPWSAAGDAACFGAIYAARDATLALVVRDLIPTELFDTLYGPWRDAIGDVLE